MNEDRDRTAGDSCGKPGKFRRWIVVSLALAAMAATLVACGNSSSNANQGNSRNQARSGAGGGGFPGGRGGSRGIPVQSVKVSHGPLNAVHNVAGSVVPVTQSEVAAQVSGVVKKVNHNAGDWVSAGDTVIQLDDSQLQLALKNAQVSLQNAQINLTVGQQNTTFDRKKLELQLKAAEASLAASQKNYDALQSAYKLGSVSASDLDTAQSQLQQAEANYESAKNALDQNQNAETQSIAQLKLAVQTAENQVAQATLNLQNASISAPFDGQIAVVHVAPGEFVSQNTPSFLLVSAERRISFNVPPADAPILTVGTAVSFQVGGDTYKAQVDQTPSAPVNGVVPLTAKIDGTASLPFGTVGTVSYRVTVSIGTLVPLAALQNDGAQNYVFTILQGKAHVQPITILGETGSTAAVSQLVSGAEVVVNPPPGLLEGAAVSPAGAQGGAPGSGQRSPGGRTPGGGTSSTGSQGSRQAQSNTGA